MLSADLVARLRPDGVRRLRAAGCVFAEEEFGLLADAAASPEEFADLLRRRVAGEPVESVVGWAWFCGERIPVHRFVFVPRTRTEALVGRARAVLRPGDAVLDLGCGTGAIALLLARTGLPSSVVACDVDEVALANARVTLTEVDARVVHSDLLDAFGSEPAFDLIAANLPYVPSAEIERLPREAREQENRVALDGGVDGLDPLRRSAVRLPMLLRPGGRFLTEVALHQQPTATGLLAEAGLDVEVAGEIESGTCVLTGARR